MHDDQSTNNQLRTTANNDGKQREMMINGVGLLSSNARLGKVQAKERVGKDKVLCQTGRRKRVFVRRRA